MREGYLWIYWGSEFLLTELEQEIFHIGHGVIAPNIDEES